MTYFAIQSHKSKTFKGAEKPNTLQDLDNNSQESNPGSAWWLNHSAIKGDNAYTSKVNNTQSANVNT